MSDCKLVSFPLASDFKLSSDSCPTTEEEIKKMAHVPYSSAVGNLMYAMVCSKLDLSYAVSVVSHFMHSPGKDHWDAMKWILHYMKGSLDKCLVFDKSKPITLDVAGHVRL